MSCRLPLMAIPRARQVDIVLDWVPCHPIVAINFCKTDDNLERTMRNRVELTPSAFLLLFLVAFLTSSGSSQNPDGQTQMQAKSNVVYVCACLKTKSCSCMTEAKMEGPCACGTQGGPPLKAVSKDSDWAKENRAALAK
jgi:hypothetical protein